MRSAWTWIMLCLAAIALAGCGGGDSSSNNNPGVTAANVTLGVNWAARGRDVNAPSSAQSVTATVVGGSEQSTDVTVSANRNPAPAAYTQTLTFPSAIKLGTQTVQIRFFAEANGAGAVVGTASTTVNVVAGGTSVGNVTTTAKITSVTIAEGSSLPAGTTQDLTVTAKDSENNVVAVSPGSIIYNVTAGGNRVRVTNGQVEGVLAGQATVTATIDTIASSPANISVIPVITKLEALDNAALYGKVRLRVRGIGAAEDTVGVQIGNTAATGTVVGYTDANAPAASSTSGGAVDFVVPTGLFGGAQALALSVNGAVAVSFPVTVSNTNPFATFTLANGGKFVAELRRDKSPNTVDNFTGLATGTKTWTPTYNSNADGSVKTAGSSQNTPLYDGIKFHRVIAGFVRQGGDPITKLPNPPADWTAGTGGPGFTIPFEVNDLIHLDGALAMARSQSLNSAGSQIFIDDGAQPNLNITKDARGDIIGGYVVFGYVIENLSVAKAIAQNDVLQSVVISGKIESAAQ